MESTRKCINIKYDISQTRPFFLWSVKKDERQWCLYTDSKPCRAHISFLLTEAGRMHVFQRSRCYWFFFKILTVFLLHDFGYGTMSCFMTGCRISNSGSPPSSLLWYRNGELWDSSFTVGVNGMTHSWPLSYYSKIYHSSRLAANRLLARLTLTLWYVFRHNQEWCQTRKTSPQWYQHHTFLWSIQQSRNNSCLYFRYCRPLA